MTDWIWDWDNAMLKTATSSNRPFQVRVAVRRQVGADQYPILVTEVSAERSRDRLRGKTAVRALVSIAINGQIGAIINHRPMFPLIQEWCDAGIGLPTDLPRSVGPRPGVHLRVASGAGLPLEGRAVVNDQNPSIIRHKIARAVGISRKPRP